MEYILQSSTIGDFSSHGSEELGTDDVLHDTLRRDLGGIGMQPTVVARPDLGCLRENQVIEESLGNAGQIHMTFDGLHSAIDFQEIWLAELRDIQFLVALQFWEYLGPETIAESTKEVFEKKKPALHF
jgi:hypothetical protein